ncbi:von Willebrand factor type A domain-containing protein [Roseibium hamelinense]|uniref:von Willebrand factor type A domain-containing protein n=1 Tax=Roseibium hamelinense TaxID=150831 RepID=A0A562SHG4_9HYPH|nr:vWA domain-containing protein [Roseibium hamelinense]MTI42502.1 VWA domain-containing protein [Roseibium hamelinense]TWI80699.1 von Willebrand factor type A domain-containing protein [Roseibium hamelinense]
MRIASTFKATKKVLITATAISCMSAAAQASSTDILFILDGSGSMWGQIDKVAKITTAKDTLSRLIDDVPEGARVGLMTYGTQSKESCTDFMTLNAVGSTRDDIKSSIAGITPLGKTPMALSLTLAITQLSKTEPTDRQKAVVLISDGIETCDADPCSNAALSQYLGVDMKVHVVGFDVDKEAKDQLQCIANAGSGQYFDAADTDGFQAAMAQVVQVAQAAEPAPEPVAVSEPEPEPAGPVITEFFREDFDGVELSDNWTVENANPDAFIVEDGNLLMLSTRGGGFESAEPQNLVTYAGDLPAGDWDVEITYTGEYSTNADRLTLGMRKDEANFLATSYYSSAPGTGCLKSELALAKMSSGTQDREGRLFRSNQRSCYATTPIGAENWATIQEDHSQKPIKLTFSKRGRSYSSTVEMLGFTDADGDPYVVSSDKYTSLRSPGTLAFTVDRPGRNASGEVLMMIDSVVINEVTGADQ